MKTFPRSRASREGKIFNPLTSSQPQRHRRSKHRSPAAAASALWSWLSATIRPKREVDCARDRIPVSGSIMKTPFLFATLALSLATVSIAEPEAVKNVTVAEAAKVIGERKDVVVIDVRTDAEFKEGHIAGAKNIDFLDADFAKKVGELDKSKTYVVHCAGGGRSTKSLDAFKAQKITSILHMNEGFKAWVAAGKPVEK